MIPKISLILLLGCVVLGACAPATEAIPTPTNIFATPIVNSTETLVPGSEPTVAVSTSSPVATTDSFTPIPAATNTPQPGTPNVCSDPQVTALIDTLKTAVLNSDGTLLASVVSPTSGMDVRWIRNGMVVNYDASQAKFLFETTFEVDWGVQPGSGEPKVGAFHDVIVPDLSRLFNQSYTLHCNELKYGGATYEVSWPYDKDFYSIHFPGTAANGNMDWHTWVAGIEYVDGKPYIYALTQFFWEP